MERYIVEVTEDEICWKNEAGELHRLDGPAIEYTNGYRAWWFNGKRHRGDGPAIEYANGTKAWFLNGKRHRGDGPAIEYANGYTAWWFNGNLHREEEHAAMVNSCSGKVVEIDGKKYRLTEV